MNTRMWPKGPWLAALAIATSVACGSTSVDPETDLSGSWDFSFDTMTPGCVFPPPGSGVPPRDVIGCAGAGTLVLGQSHIELTGTVPLFGSCRTCSSISDFFGAPQPVIGSLIDSHLEFAIGGRCTFTGQAIDGPREYTGEATCRVDGETTNGRWRLARRP